MRQDLLASMQCPYCDGDFTIAKCVRGDAERIHYGLIECRCFRFPIVDGVLLLSMAKGYGGAEEALQPYAPLQVAAMKFLDDGDVEGFEQWISRHLPLATKLLSSADDANDTYMETAARLHDAGAEAAEKFLADQHRYEVVGVGTPSRKARLSALARKVRPRRSTPSEELLRPLAYYYLSRFLEPRANSLALMLRFFRLPGSVLSLCCGHGIVETLLCAMTDETAIVSVDAQFLNLLVTRRFANPNGSFICHDVQFPLPFRSGAFDAVTSSTCLPEIPAQSSFVREAIRVTAEEGWTLFDSVWNTEVGVTRVDRGRSYRFCQNFFADLNDYVPFFDQCAGPSRSVGVDVPAPPDGYLSGATWVFGRDREQLLTSRADSELNFVVVARENRPFVESPRAGLTADRLSICPAFAIGRDGSLLRLVRRPGFDSLHPTFAPRTFPGFPPTADIDLGTLDEPTLLKHFAMGELSVLPNRFGGGYVPLARL